jgi:hypothetical protein
MLVIASTKRCAADANPMEDRTRQAITEGYTLMTTAGLKPLVLARIRRIR